MIRVRNFFTQNILWKLIALILAIILWVIAINVEDPWTLKSVGAELEIRNLELLEENDLVLLNQEHLQNRNINARVRARRSGLSSINQEGITAYIDMADINFYDPDTIDMTLEAEVYLEIDTILSRNEFEATARPGTIPIVIDRIITKEIPVRVDTINAVGSSFVALTPTVNPATVLVTGPQSYIAEIEDIVATIDLEGSSNNVNEMVKPVIYNNNRRDITERFELNVTEVEVAVPINVYRRVPVNQPNIVGSLPSGHNIIGVYYTPTAIEVVGSVEEINTINSLDIGNIDVSGATSDISVVVNMEQKLGPNLSIRNGTPNTVTVTVSISDEFVTNISVPITQFYIEGDTSNIEFESHIEVGLVGDRNLLESITYGDIWGDINVEGLYPGEHEVLVNLILPQGVTSIGSNIVTKVTVYEEESTDNDNDLSEELEAPVIIEDEYYEDTLD